MFGIKLRSWMEAHMVLRPRKKRSKEAKEAAKAAKAEAKGGSRGLSVPTVPLPDPPAKSALVDTSQSMACSPAAGGAPAKRVTLVSPSPSCRVSHHKDRAPGDSPRRPPQLPPAGSRGGGACGSSPRGSSGSSSTGGPRYSTYLSSPESAYSTGYSTDATSPHGYSPGASLPPEYYINLRTGTRYFQSAERQQQQQLQLQAAQAAQPQQQQQGNDGAWQGREELPRVRFGHQRTLSSAAATTAPPAGASQQQQQQPHHHPYCRHTVAKVSCTTLEEGGFSYGAPVPPPRQQHRRTESADCNAPSRGHVTIRTSFAQVEEVTVSCSPRRVPLTATPAAASLTPVLGCNSPRQRSRIRTNPWMSTTSSSATTEKQWTTTTSSSCSDIAPRTEDISTAATVGSWRRDDGHTTTTTTADEEEEKVTAFRRPSRRRRGPDALRSPAMARRSGSLSSSQSSTPPSTPRRSTPSTGREEDEEDLTLNEIGRFDESYVYEKETDILSDSDPTDCDEEADYNNGNLTDRHSSNDFLDMSYQNGLNSSNNCLKAEFDEDELDFIDNGPYDVSCELARINTGHCTYHQVTDNRPLPTLNNNNMVSRPTQTRPGSKRSGSRRREKRASSLRREEHASPSRRGQQQQQRVRERRAASSSSRRGRQHRDVRALAEEEGSSSGQATPVVGGSSSSTPMLARRALRRSPARSPARTPKTMTPDKRVPNPSPRTYTPSEVRLLEADKEADRKYRQLIAEAETLLVHMKSASFEEDEILEIETPTVEELPSPFSSAAPVIGYPVPVARQVEPPPPAPEPEISRTEVEVSVSTSPPPRQQSSPPRACRPDTTGLILQVNDPHTPAGSHSRPPVHHQQPRQQHRQGMQQSVVAIQVTTPSGGPPRELVTFRSVDLSSPVAAEAPYCPQSEPLKRKVYTPAALHRLQQSLALADCAESSDSSPPDDDEHSAQDRLGQKVAALRRERLAAEARLASREEERRRRREARERARAQQQLAIERRHTLLSTLESLKKDLQVQSASLHDSYSSITDLRSPSAADAQRSLLGGSSSTTLPDSPLASALPLRMFDKPRCDFLSPIRRTSSLRSPTAPPPPPRRCC